MRQFSIVFEFADVFCLKFKEIVYHVKRTKFALKKIKKKLKKHQNNFNNIFLKDDSSNFKHIQEAITSRERNNEFRADYLQKRDESYLFNL